MKAPNNKFTPIANAFMALMHAKNNDDDMREKLREFAEILEDRINSECADRKDIATNMLIAHEQIDSATSEIAGQVGRAADILERVAVAVESLLELMQGKGSK